MITGKGCVMFYKAVAITLLLSPFIYAEKSNFQSEGVSVQMVDTSGHVKHMIVKRDIPDECKKVPINNAMVWTGNYANAKVPEACNLRMCIPQAVCCQCIFMMRSIPMESLRYLPL